jgi:hypothetical protein
MTLVTIGSDEIIGQINEQVLKLVDVVNTADMTLDGHIGRELARALASRSPGVRTASAESGTGCGHWSTPAPSRAPAYLQVLSHRPLQSPEQQSASDEQKARLGRHWFSLQSLVS